ncbi:hypothetical protein AgCh_031052 [Apium graveolens]
MDDNRVGRNGFSKIQTTKPEPKPIGFGSDSVQIRGKKEYLTDEIKVREKNDLMHKSWKIDNHMMSIFKSSRRRKLMLGPPEEFVEQAAVEGYALLPEAPQTIMTTANNVDVGLGVNTVKSRGISC